MKKNKNLKIKLNPETVRALTVNEIPLAKGGFETIPSEGTGCKTCG